MALVDTHCHIHSADYPMNAEEAITRAAAAEVNRLICVGTTAEDSVQAVNFARQHQNCWASIGLHPHDAKLGQEAFDTLRRLLDDSPLSSTNAPSAPFTPPMASTPLVPAEYVGVNGDGRAVDRSDKTEYKKVNLSLQSTALGSPPTRPNSAGTLVPKPLAGWDGARVASGRVSDNPWTEGEGASKIVAIGECGLDYFYNHSSKADQLTALRFQIELALTHNLPMIFHVREAFDDFWPVFDSYPGIRGVLHSFTDNRANLDKGLERGLCIGVNGIATFTKNDWQRDNYRAIPLDKMILETDAPFLTPAPLRGTINEPANVRRVCDFLAELRQESLEKLANATTQTALNLFALK